MDSDQWSVKARRRASRAGTSSHRGASQSVDVVYQWHVWEMHWRRHMRARCKVYVGMLSVLIATSSRHAFHEMAEMRARWTSTCLQSLSLPTTC